MPQIFTRTLTAQDAMQSGPTVNACVGFVLPCEVEHGKNRCVSDEPLMAFVALGANLGDAAGTLRLAAAELAGWSSARSLGSSLWRTKPVACPPGSPPFLNAVLGLQPEPGVTPESLLDDLLALEARLGRIRSSLANAPRAIDLDLIVFGDEMRVTPTLTLPHSRAHERAFVLAPLAEIAPNLILPGQKKTVAGLLAMLGQAEEVVKIEPLMNGNEC
ncbi:MAG TPA: 2-amino-4-hydroxy-6-hydroxymethyldihydropteridine diphosphokinase [Verrucomicrobiota bacterium]|nr:2-amino-4-hydroxy-6-hydroxymethyldihydropteridine diphosphokinase [Verrucomicrobiota bacterium]